MSYAKKEFDFVHLGFTIFITIILLAFIILAIVGIIFSSQAWQTATLLIAIAAISLIGFGMWRSFLKDPYE